MCPEPVNFFGCPFFPVFGNDVKFEYTSHENKCNVDILGFCYSQIRLKDTANPPPGAAVRLNVSDADTTFFSMT